jgi:hypothetical protein
MTTDEFNKHDNIDREVIEVSKSFLLLQLKDCEKYASLPAETVGYGGIAITLFATVFLTETTRNLWNISGSTVQAAFLVGAIVATVITVRKGILWYRIRNRYTPEAIIESLIKKEARKPIALLPAPSPESQNLLKVVKKPKDILERSKKPRIPQEN